MTKILQPRDQVGLISPSRWLRGPEEIELGIAYLQGLGLKVIPGDHIYDRWRYMAGTPQDRATDLMGFYQNPEIKAIFCTSGGDGSQLILPHLDFEAIKQNPKPIFGFSDNNALQQAIVTQTGQVGYTGFVLNYNFAEGHINPLVDQSLNTLLNGQKLLANGGQTVIPGSSEGILIGGCLSLFRNLCGTIYFPDLSNKILLIEDVEETTYKLDLMLAQISQQPGFSKLRGIIFGKFYDCPIRRPDDGDISEMIEVFCRDLDFPIIKDFPYGHQMERYVLPLGGTIKLDASLGQLEYSAQ